MKMLNKNKKIIILFILILFIFLNKKFAMAQSNNLDLILTWQAINFYPNFYQGKNYPTLNSLLILKVQITKNNKLLPPENILFNWEINLNHFSEKIGLDTIKIEPLNFLLDKKNLLIKINAIIENKEMIEKIIEIPIKEPLIIIENSYPTKIINFPQANIKVFPYFFKASQYSDFKFEWYINNILYKEINSDNLKIFLNKEKYGAFNDYIILKIKIKNYNNNQEAQTKILKININF